MSDLLTHITCDLRFAFRGLARSRGFTLIAVLSLAVGIGVNTALFTYVHATLLQPVPGVTGAEQIIEPLLTRRGIEQQEWAYPDFQDVRDAETPIELLVGYKEASGSLTTPDGNQQIAVMYVSPSYFSALGVRLALGREFLAPEGERPGEHPVAVLSHALWQGRFGGDTGIVGQTISVNRISYTVIGVAPATFTGHRPFSTTADLWVPLMQHPFIAGERQMMRDRASQWLLVLGRLRPGATLDQTNAALETIFARLKQEYPETNEDRGARAYAFGPLPAYGRAGSVAMTAGLVALTILVLLIICGNVTGMLLARSVTRGREIAMRLALGSGRGRLARHLLAEAALLAIAGGGLGIVLAFWGTSVASSSGLALDIPNITLQPNAAILILSLLLTLLSTLAIGLLPAIRFSRPEFVSALKDDAGGGGRRVGRTHRLAASAQTGLALFLLVIGSLFVRAMGAWERRDLGFEPQNLLVTRMDLSLEGYTSPEEGLALLDRIKESVGALPGVTAVSIGDGIPLDLVGNFTRVGRTDRPDEESGRVIVEFTRAGEEYFEVIGTPILQGRGIEANDDASSPPVVVITRALAERLWPGEPALGRQLRFSLIRESPLDFTVVGIVSDVASSRATENWPHLFVALRQQYSPRVMIAASGSQDASALIRPIQSAILDIDPSLPIPQVIPSVSLVSRSTEGQRSGARMAGGLGLLALLLSAIGVYGVVAFAVANRTREIGIRMALGATRPEVLATVLRDAMRLAIPGLLVGGVLAVGTAVAMRSILLGLSPLDPISFCATACALLAVVLMASLVPARRASSIDPMEALRGE